MNTQPEPLRPGPAPAGQPCWIYSKDRPDGYYSKCPEYLYADDYQWLPAPACPPRPPAEKTVEELDRDAAKQIWISGLDREDAMTMDTMLDCIRYGRADERRRFARELLKSYHSQTQRRSILEELEEAAK